MILPLTLKVNFMFELVILSIIFNMAILNINRISIYNPLAKGNFN